MGVKFLDLAHQTRTVSENVLNQYRILMDQSLFVGGEAVSRFEKEFAEYINADYCVALNSGTDALRLGLIAGGIRSQDEVLTSPLTFIATAEAANQVGNVRFADVDTESFNLSCEEVENKLTERTRAVIPVHIYGLPADMPAFERLAEKENLLLIEDSCQAHGSSISDRKTGNYGRGATFSFYPTKNLSAFGDAGAFTSNDPEIGERVLLLRNHGQTGPYKHDFEGFNSRMDAFQAVVLLQKLRFLERWNQERQVIACHYSSGLEDLVGIRFQKGQENFTHVYHLFPILSENRDELSQFLETRSIQTRIIYPIPLHLMEAYRHLGYKRGDFPNAEKICATVLCLPVYPGLGMEEVDTVISGIREFYRAGG